MTKASKILLTIVGVLIVLVIAAVIITAVNLGPIIKKGVETYGPQIAKVPITLDSVHIGVLTGSADVKGLVVGNPTNYTAPEAISVGEVSVGVNPFSLLSDKIVVRSIKVKSPSITFEGGLSGNNLSDIKDNINGTAEKGGPTVTNSVGKPKAAKKLEVDDFVITGAKVSGRLRLFAGKEITVKNLPLPDIHLTNLGKGPNGITATDLTKRVFGAITKATIEAVTKYGTDIGKGAINVGGQGVDKIKKGIGNLLGK